MYFNRKCKVTFICHGSTIYSEENRISDNENYPPLSDYGQEEIEKICQYLKKRGVKNNAIYTSAATRTVQSAKMIAKLYKSDYTIVEDLKPRKCGKFNGLTMEHIEEKQPELLEKWFSSTDYVEEIEAESIKDYVKHTTETINKLVSENDGNRIIIVTYPEVIIAAIGDALGIPLDKVYNIFIRPGSATQISYYQGWASLVYSDYIPL